MASTDKLESETKDQDKDKDKPVPQSSTDSTTGQISLTHRAKVTVNRRISGGKKVVSLSLDQASKHGAQADTKAAAPKLKTNQPATHCALSETKCIRCEPQSGEDDASKQPQCLTDLCQTGIEQEPADSEQDGTCAVSSTAVEESECVPFTNQDNRYVRKVTAAPPVRRRMAWMSPSVNPKHPPGEPVPGPELKSTGTNTPVPRKTSEEVSVKEETVVKIPEKNMTHALKDADTTEDYDMAKYFNYRSNLTNTMQSVENPMIWKKGKTQNGKATEDTKQAKHIDVVLPSATQISPDNEKHKMSKAPTKFNRGEPVKSKEAPQLESLDSTSYEDSTTGSGDGDNEESENKSPKDKAASGKGKLLAARYSSHQVNPQACREKIVKPKKKSFFSTWSPFKKRSSHKQKAVETKDPPQQTPPSKDYKIESQQKDASTSDVLAMDGKVSIPKLTDMFAASAAKP